jgi:hypothetical protein
VVLDLFIDVIGGPGRRVDPAPGILAQGHEIPALPPGSVEIRLPYEIYVFSVYDLLGEVHGALLPE